MHEAVREPGAGEVLLVDASGSLRGARIEPGMRVVVDEDGVLVLPAG